MSKKFGVPYMGSKRKLAHTLIDFMKKHHTEIYKEEPKYFYDVFGGGGSMSFEALQHDNFKKVFYNEINPAIVALIKDVKQNGVSDKYYRWISREEFFRCKDKSDLKAGICQCIMSFGNNQKDYLYSRKIEKEKELLHNIIIKNCKKSLRKINEKYNLGLGLEFFRIETTNEKRIELYRHFRRINMRNDVPHIERLKNLEKIEKIEGLGLLEISNLSYEELKINTPISQTIVYFDPPYQGTKQYRYKVDYKGMHNYIKNSPYMIYLSEYNNSFLECVLEINHKSSFSATNNNKRSIEKLFVNKTKKG
jgi:site-specific DNA-adenine methylase